MKTLTSPNELYAYHQDPSFYEIIVGVQWRKVPHTSTLELIRKCNDIDKDSRCSVRITMAYAWQLLSVFKTIKDNIWQDEDVIIDSLSMRMNYKATVSFLLASSCLVTFNTWFGGEKPIECISNTLNRPGDTYMADYCLIHDKRISVNQECWNNGNWNITVTDMQNQEGTLCDGRESSNVHIITYYEWTAIFLVAQALCFYATRFIWMRLENGVMKYMKATLDKPELTEDKKAQLAAEIIKERHEKNFNNLYSVGFCFSELLCHLNLILQWKITNLLLNPIEQNWINRTSYDFLNVLDFYRLGIQFLVHVLKDGSPLPVRDAFKILFG